MLDVERWAEEIEAVKPHLRLLAENGATVMVSLEAEVQDPSACREPACTKKSTTTRKRSTSTKSRSTSRQVVSVSTTATASSRAPDATNVARKPRPVARTAPASGPMKPPTAEIAAVLATHEAVAEAVVVVREDGGAGGSRQLVAYHVRRTDGGAPPGEDLADWVLAEFEPEDAKHVLDMMPKLADDIQSYYSIAFRATPPILGSICRFSPWPRSKCRACRGSSPLPMRQWGAPRQRR